MAASCKTWRILILWVVLYFLCVDVVCWSKSIPEVGDKEDELEEQRMRDQDYQDLLSAYPESQPDDGQESPRLSRWAMPVSCNKVIKVAGQINLEIS